MSNTKKKAHINWHFTCQLARMKTLKNNISEAYKVQVECLKDSESDSYDENDMEEKLNGVAQGNARKIKNSIIFTSNPNSSLGTL